jgi:hypothetical protein
MFKRNAVFQNAVAFVIGFVIPLSLVGCGKKDASTVAEMARAPEKSHPQPVDSSDPLAIYSVSVAIDGQTNSLTIAWEVGVNLNATYDVWSCPGDDGATCKPFLIADCASTPGTCIARNPAVTTGTSDLTSHNGPVQFTQAKLSNGHQLITLIDAAATEIPDLTMAVDARDSHFSDGGEKQFSH